MSKDVTKHKWSGDLCTTSRGREILWNGHLCEGANLAQLRDTEFCLWTRCGQHDVPASKGHEGDIKEVTCSDCRAIWDEENGQFGVGS